MYSRENIDHPVCITILPSNLLSPKSRPFCAICIRLQSETPPLNLISLPGPFFLALFPARTSTIERAFRREFENRFSISNVFVPPLIAHDKSHNPSRNKGNQNPANSTNEFPYHLSKYAQ